MWLSNYIKFFEILWNLIKTYVIIIKSLLLSSTSGGPAARAIIALISTTLMSKQCRCNDSMRVASYLGADVVEAV